MALARQRADWLRVGVATAWIVNRNGLRLGDPISPLDVIPPHYHPVEAAPREKTPEELAEESRLAWVALDTFFGKA